MNSHFQIFRFLYLIAPLIVIALLLFVVIRSTSFNCPIRLPYHFNRTVRGLAALVAIAAVASTAIGTWRYSSGVPNADTFHVTVPTKPVHVNAEGVNNSSVETGQAQLIYTMILARQVGERYFPLHGESRVVEIQPGNPSSLKFVSRWKDYQYTASIQTGKFSRRNGVLESSGSLYMDLNVLSRNVRRSAGVLPIGRLNTIALRDVMGVIHQRTSLVPVDDWSNLYLLIHLALADPGDPLRETPALNWLANEAFPPGSMIYGSGYARSGDDSSTGPSFGMAAYLGPASWLLVLAAAAGSLCFRRGWRGPAFAGLTAVMVLYAGSMDALVLQRRARAMADTSSPESTRVMAAITLPSTFFHKARATEFLDEIARDAKAPAALREMAKQAAEMGD